MPRSPQAIQKLQAARRQQILTVSLRLFAINGYDATSVNNIATAIGCSHGLIYHYFKDKEAIFITLLDQALELGYMPFFPKLTEAHLANPDQTLQEIINHIFIELDREESSFAFYFYLFLNMRFQKTAPAPRFRVPQKELRPFGIIMQLVEAGQTKGVFSHEEARDLAITFFATMRGLTYVKLNEGSTFKLPSVVTIMNIFSMKGGRHA